MALSIKDGTRQSTLDLLSKEVKFPVVYARMEGIWLTTDGHPGRAFTANLACYAYEPESHDEAPTIYQGIGSGLTAAESQRMAQMDDREVLYAHVEYLLHFQDAMKRRDAEPEKFDFESEQAGLTALAQELGIDTEFVLEERSDEQARG